MTNPNNAAALTIFEGTVLHRRLRPTGHMLRYRVFNFLIDLARLDEADGYSRLFRVNKRGVLSFLEKDHGDGRARGLRGWVVEQLEQAGIANSDQLVIQALCYPRMFGYVFNPITVYFCSDSLGNQKAFIYEVNNTMGERHCYVIPVEEGQQAPFRQECQKAMYVSPFTPMECGYHFRILPPTDCVTVGIHQVDKDGPLLNASFTGAAIPATAKSISQTLLRHPMMTLKIIAGIHFEAFRLWRKGVPFFRHTPQVRGEISIVKQISSN
jgi:DUF1365 family protein